MVFGKDRYSMLLSKKVAATVENRPIRLITKVSLKIPDFWSNVGVGKKQYVNCLIINKLVHKLNFVTFGNRQVTSLLLPVIIGIAEVSKGNSVTERRFFQQTCLLLICHRESTEKFPFCQT